MQSKTCFSTIKSAGLVQFNPIILIMPIWSKDPRRHPDPATSSTSVALALQQDGSQGDQAGQDEGGGQDGDPGRFEVLGLVDHVLSVKTEYFCGSQVGRNVVFRTLLDLWTTVPFITAVRAVHSPVAPGVFLQTGPIVALSLVVQITMRSS